MSEKRISLNELFSASGFLIEFGKGVSEGPILHSPRYQCRACGTDLRITYMESRVYLIACPECETTTLVRAGSPSEALSKVGVPPTSEWVPIKRTWPVKKGRYLVTYREWSNGEFLPEYDQTYVRILRFAEAIFQLPRCIDPRAEADTNREVIAWMELPGIYKEVGND